MRKKLAAGVVAGLIAALGFVMPASALSATEADLYVLHAVPGDVPVDVYLNGTLALRLESGQLTAALHEAAGTYDVVVTDRDAPLTDPPIAQASVTLEANKSYTAVAHLNESGAGVLITAFENDIAPTAAGQGRLTVRHTAAAPAVDVLANGAVVVPSLTNPNQATLNLPAGTISAAVALAGTTDPVIGPADVPIVDGVLTIVYAWGDPAAENQAFAVQTIPVGHGNPGGVISGTAGYAAQRDQLVQGMWTLGGVAIVAIGLAALVMIRRSRVES